MQGRNARSLENGIKLCRVFFISEQLHGSMQKD